MTALSGPIVFNNSGSGSDTAASGCGPATPVSVMLQFSNGSSTAQGSWTGTISPGDIVYVPANSGRKFNVVSSASSGTGTINFDSAWGDDQFGTTGYVGGKRATIDNSDSRRLFHEDVSDDNWDVEIEYTGSDYAVTSSIDLAGHKTITGTGSSKPSIKASNFAGSIFSIAAIGTTYSSLTPYHNYSFQNLDLSVSATRTYPTDTSMITPSGSTAAKWNFYDCTFNTGSSTTDVAFELNQDDWSFRNCVFKCTLAGIYLTSNLNVKILGCYFQDGQYGTASSLDIDSISIVGSVFDSQTVRSVSTSFAGTLVNNIIYNSASGVNLGSSGQSHYGGTIVYGNIFHSCTNAIEGYSSQNIQGNGFYSNTTKYNFTAGFGTYPWTIDDVDFTADPLTDPANGDFSLSSGVTSEVNAYLPLGAASTTGGAPALESLSLRSFDSSTGGGGSGAVLHPLRSN